MAPAVLPHCGQEACVDLDLCPFKFHLGFLPHQVTVWDADNQIS